MKTGISIKHSVVRFKNYGCTFTGPDEESDWENKFYWSFYELNNGKTICLHLTENLFKGKLVETEFSYFYTKDELKNGKILSYNFGNANANDGNAMSKEFFQWFDSLPPYHHVKKKNPPTKEEINCVTEFYKKNIMDKKDEKTNTTYC
tara:strand:- start:47 stop:490 length:444 start_codon:yes stop_codon:yes gene_type:complete